MIKHTPKKIVGNWKYLITLIMCSLGFFIVNCGEIIIAGGTSEVGNPNSSAYSNNQDTSSQKIEGIEINAQGIPIRIIRKKSPTKSDSISNQLSIDSIVLP